MRHGEAAFVDSGAWIALALSRDPLHPQAREQWDLLQHSGARLHTSVPVVIETFTFLDRNANRDVAMAQSKPGSLPFVGDTAGPGSPVTSRARAWATSTGSFWAPWSGWSLRTTRGG